jgi:hypothetical protein
VVFIVLLICTYLFKINEEFQEHILKRNAQVAEASASWMLAGSAMVGPVALIVASVIYGVVAGIVGASIFSIFGGSILYERCNGRAKLSPSTCSTKASATPLSSPESSFTTSTTASSCSTLRLDVVPPSYPIVV